ncbi:hypothetical protein NDK47_21195 [Brevibacillus ruminantium]|uniref:Cell division protein ZapA n=1 Tax=Brevibacillus ruminantium TaxID=2950604 RepID=A0ABY4WBT6_9BACL|nr:hypothetical protein [Brevibacillus ruminantium]USG64635.1 hypothetical protein NDK47_21195 [Brevibacillus ruminantium]
MIERLKIIEEELKQLSPEIIVPVRTQKIVNSKAFERMYLLLDEILELIKEEDNISRKLAGRLFFLYTYLLHQAKYTNMPEEIFHEAGKIKEYLDKLLLSPFRNND